MKNNKNFEEYMNKRFIEIYWKECKTLMESKSKTDFFIKKFKEDYGKYYNKETDTYIIDGCEFKIKFSKSLKRSGTVTKYNIPIIYLGRDFLLTGDRSDRDMILRHEIGHIKLHNINPFYEYINIKVLSKRSIDYQYSKMLYNLQDKYNKMIQSEQDPQIRREMKLRYNTLKDMYLAYYKKYMDMMLETVNEEKLRMFLRDELRDMIYQELGYNFKNEGFIDEIEADMYAIYKTYIKNIRKH